MKRKITPIIFTTVIAFFALCETRAQDATYTEVIERVNAGGYLIEETTPDWKNDAFGSPSTYLSTANTEVFFEDTGTITFSASVPATVPDSVYYYERNLGMSTSDSLQWDFPITAGREVKVNLFFSENYHTMAGQRVFDIVIDGVVVQNDYDVLVDAGGENIGVMKSYTIVTDQNIDLDFVAVVERPMVNGIEILAIPEVTTGKNVATTNSFTLSPNPVNQKLVLTGKETGSEFRLVTATGQEKNIEFTQTANGYSADASTLEKGVYLLYVHSPKGREVLRFIKQ